jgi:predicted kinase
MVGIPGSGKTFFAEQFASTFNAPSVSVDKIRENIFEKPSYTKSEEEIVNNMAMHVLGEILKSGRTIVFDGSTSSKSERDQIAKASRAAGYEPLFVWVQTELPTAKSRTLKLKTNKTTRMSEEQFNNRVSRFTNPTHTEKFVVISGKHAHSSQLRIVLKRLVDTMPQTTQPTVPLRTPGNRNYLIR